MVKRRITELKDFISGPGLVCKPVKLDEGWEDVLPGFRTREIRRGLDTLGPVQDSVAEVQMDAMKVWMRDLTT